MTEMHNRKEKGIVVPPPSALTGTEGWRHVSTDLARFELSLMQLDKTELTFVERDALKKRHMKPVRNQLQFFLYDIKQLDDADESRANAFRRSIQTFLGLDVDIDPLPRENVGWGKVKKYEEHINICHAEHDSVRALLLNQASTTREWIRDKFLRSRDVHVSGHAYFVELMDTWDKDPCLSV